MSALCADESSTRIPTSRRSSQCHTHTALSSPAVTNRPRSLCTASAQSSPVHSSPGLCPCTRIFVACELTSIDITSFVAVPRHTADASCDAASATTTAGFPARRKYALLPASCSPNAILCGSGRSSASNSLSTPSRPALITLPPVTTSAVAGPLCACTFRCSFLKSASHT